MNHITAISKLQFVQTQVKSLVQIVLAQNKLWIQVVNQNIPKSKRKIRVFTAQSLSDLCNPLGPNELSTHGKGLHSLLMRRKKCLHDFIFA